ncbi:phosphonopyruvate decarboxylase [Syntrophomonas curvata]
MDVLRLTAQLKKIGVDYFAGVPDSQLKALCDYLINTFGVSSLNHIITANEGNAVALAAGYYLSTGKIPCVYLQNSGLGNIINPVTSLLNDKVYAIPCVFIVGWRGEPGVHDEPQHLFQGEITLKMLEVLDIACMVIDRQTTEQDLEKQLYVFKSLLNSGKSVALVIKQGGLSYSEKVIYKNNSSILREEIINFITEAAQDDIIIATTGKTSRELFEIREKKGQLHKYDFLTVGSMGHSSSIALGIALNKPNKRVWCIDGDGAALMHLGAMAVIGEKAPLNYIHVIINNGAHESVGGQPTAADAISFEQIALGCGYKASYHASDLKELQIVLSEIEGKKGPIFIEVKSAIGSRKDLGRPAITPIENKTVFMDYIGECS